MRAEEILVPLPSPRNLAPRATKVRGSWMLSSLRALREHALIDRYLAMLPEEHHEAIASPMSAAWLPIDLCVAHYATCERLDVPVNQLIDMGVEATGYAHSTFIGVAAKLAVGTGATPWTIFSQLQRLWDRSWVGGAVGVAKLGPKEARIEVVGWPCAGFRYTRVGMRGVLRGVAEFFCTKAYVHEIESLCTPLSLGYRLAWA